MIAAATPTAFNCCWTVQQFLDRQKETPATTATHPHHLFSTLSLLALVTQMVTLKNLSTAVSAAAVAISLSILCSTCVQQGQPRSVCLHALHKNVHPKVFTAPTISSLTSSIVTSVVQFWLCRSSSSSSMTIIIITIVNIVVVIITGCRVLCNHKTANKKSVQQKED